MFTIIKWAVCSYLTCKGDVEGKSKPLKSNRHEIGRRIKKTVSVD